jgi:hypothetical protein
LSISERRCSIKVLKNSRQRNTGERNEEAARLETTTLVWGLSEWLYRLIPPFCALEGRS